MKRRQFLAAGATAAVAAPIASPAIAQSAPSVRWRLVSAFPKSLDTLYGGSVELARRVSEATDGQFQIQPFAAGEIVPGGAAVIDATSKNTVECCHTCSYYGIGIDPTFAFGTCVPFGPNARQTNAWLTVGGGNDVLNEFYAKHNLYALPAGNTGVQMGGWFRKEINTVEDLKGIKFRVGGLAGNVLLKLGVVPQQIGGGDLYSSLERGTIDAAEWTGPYDDEKLGLYRVAKYYYYPGWWDQGTVISMMINRAKWDELPARYKAVLSNACAATNQWMQAKYDHENPIALKRVVAAGAILRPFSPAIMEASFKATQQTYDEINASNPTFKKILGEVMAYRDATSLWWQVSELPYDINIANLIRRAR
ncbi:TRAP transporter substrate-binding protein [Bosea rubneri]|uniref:TRAP transporter substrate-binding protein n=1 Tax=Bosea rubneri TaxID=3075434 RepID=A0ABU3S3P3_9HYPH|nr:TRAP transporter substrate-binding protein [Bosea sp. ZW T0_25]MDU0339410.1 TRAP transporter substrate-binding protein [Bosea sp. ZW T0_25]